MKSIIINILVASVLCLLAGIQPALAQDWPGWRGENRDSRVVGFQIPDEWPAQLDEEWRVTVGWGDATPALVSGRLYVFTREGNEEVLRCLSAESGDEVWKSSYPAAEVSGPAARHPGPRGTPAVSGNRVVVLGATGILSCYEASSGKLVWRNSEYAGIVPVYFTGSSPLVYDGKCFIGMGGREKSAFQAFDMRDGSIVWSIKGVAPSYSSPVLASALGSLMLVVQADTVMMGIAPSDGRVLWELQTPVARRYYNSASPVVEKGKIYYTGQGNGTAELKIESGYTGYTVKEQWRNSEMGTNYNTPVIRDGHLYGINERGYLFCINTVKGNLAWADTVRHRDFGSIIDAGEVLVALSGTSNMVVYKPDPARYSEVAMIKVAETPVYAHPVLSGNAIYIKDQETLIRYRVK